MSNSVEDGDWRTSFFCEHGNLSDSCSVCHPNSTDVKIQESDDHLFTENVRCRRCDAPNLAKPNLKTYKCPVCLFRSNKESWPFDPSMSTVIEKGHRSSDMIKQIRKFREQHWRKIPSERKKIIKSGDVSDEYRKIYKTMLRVI